MKKVTLSAVLLVIFICFVVLCGHSGSGILGGSINDDEEYALINGYLIDGTGNTPVANAVIIIENERIKAVGSSEAVSISENIQVIDLNGASVLPGFFNCHVHRGFERDNLEKWLEGGVTTVRDLGSSLTMFRNNRPAYEPESARLIAAGPGFTAPGGYPAVPWGSPIGYEVNSSSEAYTKTIGLISEGADIIKIFMEHGSSFGQEIPALTVSEAREIVRAARENNIRVSVHVLSSDDLRLALDAGADDIAHMITDNLSDEVVMEMVENNVYWVPTLELWKRVGNGNDQRAVNNLRKFVEAGGKVALGTDYAGYNSYFDLGMPVTEIEMMSDAGMTPMQIIVAATRHASEVCGVKEDLGTIETGKVADIIVVSGNPLENLSDLSELRMVIHGGKIISIK